MGAPCWCFPAFNVSRGSKERRDVHWPPGDTKPNAIFWCIIVKWPPHILRPRLVPLTLARGETGGELAALGGESF